MGSISTNIGTICTYFSLPSTILGIALTPKPTINSSRNVTNTTNKDFSHKILKLSDTKLKSIDVPKTNHPTYTQKQLEYAEKMGIDPSEYNEEEEIIEENNKTSGKKIHTRDTDRKKARIKPEATIEECNVYGVFTNRSTYIKKMILNKLKHDLKIPIDSWNQVKPWMLEQIKNLYLFPLNEPKQPTLDVHDLKGLSNLEKLSISHANLTILKNNMFQGLNKLMYLDLTTNNIKYIEDKVFCDIKQLLFLRLRDNKLTQLTESITCLTELKHLSLVENEITLSETNFKA